MTKRNLFLSVLLFISLAFSLTAQSLSTSGPETQLNVNTDAIGGFYYGSAATLDVAGPAATRLPATPGGARILYIRSDIALNMGGAAVASGAYNGIFVATDTLVTVKLRQDIPRPFIYLVPTTGYVTTATVRLTYGR